MKKVNQIYFWKHFNSTQEVSSIPLSCMHRSYKNCTVVTEDVHVSLAKQIETCTPAPTCIKVPPLNGRQILILAIPFLPAVNDLSQDLLCPLYPHLSDRCVDLLSCNRFSETVYAKSITICKMNNDSSMEMCFHNITEVLNGTKLHFFYSDLHCRPNDLPKSSRIYAKSIQLITEGEILYNQL